MVVSLLVVAGLHGAGADAAGGRAALPGAGAQEGRLVHRQRAARRWALTLLALIALVVSMPLWLIPPLVLILPPLIWGWLTYRVMSFDALAEHAEPRSATTLLRTHRLPLLGIGVLCGYLGAAPSIVWASGLLFAAGFFVLVPIAIWIYTLVFAFSALWFAHYCLDALAQLRAQRAARPCRRPPPAMRALEADSGRRDPMGSSMTRSFGLIVVGDEILSGKRLDKHMPKVIELLPRAACSSTGPSTSATSRRASPRRSRAPSPRATSCSRPAASAPRPTTTRASARPRRSGVPLALHPEAEVLIRERMQDTAAEQGIPYEPDRPDNVHRLNMGVFPQGATIIRNPYNKIPGFSVGDVHFVPGFPVMAWPMIESVLDDRYADLFARGRERREIGDRLRCDGGHAHAADGGRRDARIRASRCSACRASTTPSTAATSNWASRAMPTGSTRPTRS